MRALGVHAFIDTRLLVVAQRALGVHAFIDTCLLVVAQRVLLNKTLKLENAILEVKPLIPLPPPPIIPGPVESNVLLMTNLPPTADGRQVKAYLQNAALCNVKSIVFSTQPGKALLVFDGQPGGRPLYIALLTCVFRGSRVK